MSPRKLSDASREEIISLYRQTDETISSLAQRFGVSSSTISRLLKSSISESEYDNLIQQKRGLKVSSASNNSLFEFDDLSSNEDNNDSWEISSTSTSTSTLRRRRRRSSASVDNSDDSGSELEILDSPSSVSEVDTLDDSQPQFEILDDTDTPFPWNRSSSVDDSSVDNSPIDDSSVDDFPRSSLEILPSDSPDLGNDEDKELDIIDDFEGFPSLSKDTSYTQKQGFEFLDDDSSENNLDYYYSQNIDSPDTSLENTNDEDEDHIQSLENTNDEYEESNKEFEFINDEYENPSQNLDNNPKENVSDDDVNLEQLEMFTLQEMFSEEIDNFDDDKDKKTHFVSFSDRDEWDEETQWEEETPLFDETQWNDEQENVSISNNKPKNTTVKIFPISEASFPNTCYLVIDRGSELMTLPLKDFSDLGNIPREEFGENTLPVFDNHKVARRFSNRRGRVIKVPNGEILKKTSSHLQAKGITRVLMDGKVYSL